MQGNDQWVDLKEASRITGRSVTALRLLINRKKIDRIKKIHSKGQGYWMIHQDSLDQLIHHDKSSPLPAQEDEMDDDTAMDEAFSSERNSSPAMSQINHVMGLAFDHIEKQRKEWESERDKMMHGLLMYRIKYEELDRQVKLLPAPPEYVKSTIDDLERHLQEVKKEKDELSSHLDEKVKELTMEKEITEVELESARSTYEDALAELRTRLQEEEKMKEELRCELENARSELSRFREPWWKKKVW